MWECNICGKHKVKDDGFRLFVNHEIYDKVLGGGMVTRQIRICKYCLKKTGQNLEIFIK